jgi:hypothetical protein
LQFTVHSSKFKVQSSPATVCQLQFADHSSQFEDYRPPINIYGKSREDRPQIMRKTGSKLKDQKSCQNYSEIGIKLEKCSHENKCMLTNASKA